MSRIDERQDFRRGIRANKIEPFSGTGVQVTRRAQKTVTTNTTLTADDSGKTILVGAADLVLTLPAAAAGLSFRFILLAAALSTGAGLQISPVAADAIGGSVESGALTSADDKDLILAGSGDAEGDWVELECTAVDGLEWNILGSRGVWTKQG